MRIVCAWCETVMADGDEPASHGICEECFALVLDERPITQEEHAECQDRVPDGLTGPLIVHRLLRSTVVYWKDKAWVFECAVTNRQVLLHFRARIAPRFR